MSDTSSGRFDAVVVVPCVRPLELSAWRSSARASAAAGERSPEWLELGMELDEARALVARIRDAGGEALIVPSEYRRPRISREQARATALTLQESARQATGQALGPLSEGEDELLWWTFRADDLGAKQAGSTPGIVLFAIDKLDGHVRSYADWEAWRKLSQP